MEPLNSSVVKRTIKLYRAGIVGPEAVDVELLVWVLVVLGEFPEIGVGLVAAPAHDHGTIATEDEDSIAIEWIDGAGKRVTSGNLPQFWLIEKLKIRTKSE